MRRKKKQYKLKLTALPKQRLTMRKQDLQLRLKQKKRKQQLFFRRILRSQQLKQRQQQRQLKEKKLLQRKVKLL